MNKLTDIANEIVAGTASKGTMHKAYVNPGCGDLSDFRKSMAKNSLGLMFVDLSDAYVTSCLVNKGTIGGKKASVYVFENAHHACSETLNSIHNVFPLGQGKDTHMIEIKYWM